MRKQTIVDGTDAVPAQWVSSPMSRPYPLPNSDVISHDQLDAILSTAKHSATLQRGVYTTLYYGVPFCFAVKYDGTGYLGCFLPEGMPEEEMIDRLYDRLETDDALVLRLMA